MIDQKNNHDMRLIIVFCGLVLLFTISLRNSDEASTAVDPLVCFTLDANLTGLKDENCSNVSGNSKSSYTNPELSVFYFEPIPINLASFKLLQTVPGVGPKLAQQILDYREQIGRFTGLESLKMLAGVGDRRANYLVTQFTFN